MSHWRSPRAPVTEQQRKAQEIVATALPLIAAIAVLILLIIAASGS